MSNIKVIKYFGDSCGPCKIMAPIFDRVSAELTEEGFQFESRNVGEGDYADEARSFGARGIPTFVVFKDARPLGMKTGAMSEDMLRNYILQLARDNEDAA